MPICLSTHTFRSRTFLFAVLSWLCAMTPAAQGQLNYYETALTLQQPVVNVSDVQRVVYRWSTLQTTGLVTEFDVHDLVLILETSSGTLYTDPMVVGGAAQPLAGFPRFLGGGNDIFFQFDLPSSTLEQMTNVNKALILTTTGHHFDVHDSTSIPDDNRVSVKSYIDGVNQDPHTDQLDFQVTVPMIFFDGFETGDFTDWASTSP